MARKILLTVPDKMYNKLKNEVESYSYSSIQEVVLDAVREKYFRRSQSVSSVKPGRPKEVSGLDRLKVLGRKRIFD